MSYLNTHSSSQIACTASHSAHDMRGSSLRLCFMQKGSFRLSRHVSLHDTRNTQHIFHIFFFCSWSSTTVTVDHILNTCTDPQHRQDGSSYAEQPPLTSIEPNRIVDNQIVDDQENVQVTEMRIMSKLCPTSSRFCLQPETGQKALQRHKK